jgi:hypothetical protein
MIRYLPLLLLVAASPAPENRRPASAADGPERAADAGDKMICKRFVETGSLVKGYRTCKTKREWERERENVRTENWSNGCGQIGENRC